MKPSLATGWRLITPSSAEALDLDSVKTHLRVVDSLEDELIVNLIRTATDYVESEGRILSTQTWEMLMDGFPICDPIIIWKNPVQTVDFIKYIDTDGNVQTWDPLLYQVALTGEHARIQPAYGEAWPSARLQPEAVTVRFTAGYDNSPASLPNNISAAMKLLIGHLYENREAVIADPGMAAVEIPYGIEALLRSALRRDRVY